MASKMIRISLKTTNLNEYLLKLTAVSISWKASGTEWKGICSQSLQSSVSSSRTCYFKLFILFL